MTRTTTTNNNNSAQQVLAPIRRKHKFIDVKSGSFLLYLVCAKRKIIFLSQSPHHHPMPRRCVRCCCCKNTLQKILLLENIPCIFITVASELWGKLIFFHLLLSARLAAGWDGMGEGKQDCC
jgi:hypothetical protein